PIQRSRLHARVNAISAIIYDRAFGVTQYINLRVVSEELAKENANLRANAQKVTLDSTFKRQGYIYIPAQVINNSVNKIYNYLTLDKGADSGVEPDMAVVSPFGIVGVVKSVSPGYARVISVLNPQLRISVRLNQSQYFGSMNWDTQNYRDVVVSEIPAHVEVAVGDTVITSGYSAIFPAGELVATVKEVIYTTGGNFIEIRAGLTNDFKRLHMVYIVKNINRDELKELERSDYEK
ncbi:MAG: rod shape-determining protein MreC, partial [Bacteroidales bacterium]|nr:rod shape-determining protein MreC [Bacteroidales bacterium]